MVWDIFDEMQRMQEEMDRIFNDFFAHTPHRQLGPEKGKEIQKTERMPGMRKAFVDVQETEKDVIVTAELPGMDREDIELNVTSDRVEIKAQRREERTEEKEGFKTFGRRYAGFFRSVPLVSVVKPEDAKATYKNGVLEITLPKKEVTKSRSIKIG
jgi:HSP20 family protein